MTVPVLSGPRLRLRAPMEADGVARHALGNDPEIHRMYGGSRYQLRQYTMDDARQWIAQLAGTPLGWVIECDGRLIGEIRLHGVNLDDRRAMLAVGIADPQMLGRGYGREAIRLVLGFAFGELGLHRIGLRVLAYNQRAIACYRHCGFVVEGREREAAFVDGAWHDDLIMGVLASDLGDKTDA